MMMCMMLSILPLCVISGELLYRIIVHLDVVLYSQSVLLSHWKVTIQCVVYCYLTSSTNSIVSYFGESNDTCHFMYYYT